MNKGTGSKAKGNKSMKEKKQKHEWCKTKNNFKRLVNSIII